MANEPWAAVDHYLTGVLIGPNPALDATLFNSTAAGLPEINVTPTQGKLLHLLAKSIRAKTILEIGTLGGYSTIWLARALPPDGKLITLEAVAKHAEVARKNIDAARVGARVDIRLGKALDALPQLVQTHAGAFDLIFIDADKSNNPHYVEWALKLTHPGSLIIVDNVIRDGGVADATSTDPSIIGSRRTIEWLANDKRVIATAIQTVGSKGYDGFAIALVV
jgi:predicted O-methyltransferase YrrM